MKSATCEHCGKPANLFAMNINKTPLSEKVMLHWECDCKQASPFTTVGMDAKPYQLGFSIYKVEGPLNISYVVFSKSATNAKDKALFEIYGKSRPLNCLKCKDLHAKKINALLCK